MFSTVILLAGAGNAQQLPAAVAALLGKSQAPGQPSLGPSSSAGEPHTWYQALHAVLTNATTHFANPGCCMTNTWCSCSDLCCLLAWSCPLVCHMQGSPSHRSLHNLQQCTAQTPALHPPWTTLAMPRHHRASPARPRHPEGQATPLTSRAPPRRHLPSTLFPWRPTLRGTT